MPAVIVEQLNASQWHSCCPDGSGSGVGNWVQAVTDGLLAGSLYGWRVESLDLDHNRLLLAHAEPVMGRR
ncbi:hypothetical protein [Sphingomonas jatrophae]|uniref:Uncharacterized protein n=1 Tax=Sphingomonas jatrophae TaxID=1166337 RepID=A0A1I6L285_9SPHN|nr:hypothetical protein [Sphingomonas jatrophae]SFR97575.1 hypothetical protein SAMN05192580_2181 [Sphingomonas jatrophae]